MWKDIVYLRTETTALDAYNRPYSTFVDRKTYANKKSVRSSEFYQANATGLKPELIFVVRDYQGENYLTHGGKQYRIIRSYVIGDMVELTCTTSLTEENS